MLAVAATGTAFFWSQYRNPNLMPLGDESAVTLGADLHRWRILYLLEVSLMVGFGVYTAGIISFVGLLIPHAARILSGVHSPTIQRIRELLEKRGSPCMDGTH